MNEAAIKKHTEKLVLGADAARTSQE